MMALASPTAFSTVLSPKFPVKNTGTRAVNDAYQEVRS